jgi:hypothetical protein
VRVLAARLTLGIEHAERGVGERGLVFFVVFMRSGGTIQIALSNEISSHVARNASPDRRKVRMVNCNTLWLTQHQERRLVKPIGTPRKVVHVRFSFNLPIC